MISAPLVWTSAAFVTSNVAKCTHLLDGFGAIAASLWKHFACFTALQGECKKRNMIGINNTYSQANCARTTCLAMSLQSAHEANGLLSWFFAFGTQMTELVTIITWNLRFIVSNFDISLQLLTSSTHSGFWYPVTIRIAYCPCVGIP